MHPIKAYRKRHDNMSLAAFGALVGTQKAAVNKWENGIQPSPESAIKIEQATRGEIQRWMLRPDLWPAPAVAAAE